MKKKTRKIRTVLGILAATVVGIFVALIFSLDWIATSAIERYGSKTAGTRVEVSSVRIRLLVGEGSIQGLTIGNPEGFSGRDAIRLGNITITASPRRMIGDTIVIDKILVKEPSVLYEINQHGESNIGQIRKNLEQSHKTDTWNKTSDAPEKKLIIRSLIIEEGKVLVQIGSLTEKPFSAALPRIILRNVGDKNSTSPADVTRQIIGALANETTIAVPGTNIGKSLEEAFRSILNK